MPNEGTNVPVMGTKAIHRVSEAAALYARANLSDALFTQTQQRVLACLFGESGRSFTVSELIQATAAGTVTTTLIGMASFAHPCAPPSPPPKPSRPSSQATHGKAPWKMKSPHLRCEFLSKTHTLARQESTKTTA